MKAWGQLEFSLQVYKTWRELSSLSGRLFVRHWPGMAKHMAANRDKETTIEHQPQQLEQSSSRASGPRV